MLIAASAILVLTPMFRDSGWLRGGRSFEPEWNYTPAPLVMRGGDPYIRALMRTISASESNSHRPYSLLYGGDHVYDLSRHPDLCITIVSGPNYGDCTTAAGRYQMLTTTWIDKASLYHPQRSFFFWQDYSFEPEFQDEVVYYWLNDSQAWGIDLSQLLQDGGINEVLRILSPTWTSLGYGIEPNAMTDALPHIYEQVLQEELQSSGIE
ncbi:MAG: glycoside hydrolase family protein [Cyanobacteria bacterium CRU_2_1]|nr:glycoside hydrolase family protein [Cyanobacteria bacterium RU_5_0]NJR58726.1 glycoside hydrolase family protein [Cyanobacteria bacterium CRU_2_1]